MKDYLNKRIKELKETEDKLSAIASDWSKPLGLKHRSRKALKIAKFARKELQKALNKLKA